MQQRGMKPCLSWTDRLDTTKTYDAKNEELMAFRISKGIYGYKVMSFGLKNAGATYERTMQKIFDDKLNKNIECYVDDLVVKSKIRQDHLQDLRKIYRTTKKIST
ncbi:UNVERIFIED_CONTAM: hypothetical protein Sangu_0173900 [Sesamum angustifolium]|uniref:Reverse transcriptase domain-containing protein n=1 Tax=Sesamum angustifolium TaxID=2727405 RepID=A0AAW2RLR6_9LAMI